jgi:formylmethanofuran dehydrogenase subunit E
MNIKLLKKRKNIRWLKSQLKKLMKQEKDWNHFHEFECSPFFVGYRSAEINNKRYDRAMKKIYAKMELYEKLLGPKAYDCDSCLED